MKRKIIVIAAILKAALVIALFMPGLELTVPAIAEQKDEEKEKSHQVKADFLLDDKERGLISSIARRQKELDEKEEALRVKEERLEAIKADIDSRIEELNRTHSKIDAALKKIDEINGERIKRIVKIYESMNPEDAAPRLEKLSEDMAVMILASVSERKAAKILGFVDPGKSAKLSQALRVKKD